MSEPRPQPSNATPQPGDSRGPFERPEVRWGVGCLLGMSALLGLMIITLLVSFALSPPTWVQILMGLGLVAAGAALTWLVAAALARK